MSDGNDLTLLTMYWHVISVISHLLFSPTNANLIYTFQPIFTAFFAWALLGETMGPAGFVGGGIIGLSVFIVASVGSVNNEKKE